MKVEYIIPWITTIMTNLFVPLLHEKALHLVASCRGMMTKQSYVHYYFILITCTKILFPDFIKYHTTNSFLKELTLTSNKAIIKWYSSWHLITNIYCSYIIVTTALLKMTAAAALVEFQCVWWSDEGIVTANEIHVIWNRAPDQNAYNDQLYKRQQRARVLDLYK